MKTTLKLFLAASIFAGSYAHAQQPENNKAKVIVQETPEKLAEQYANRPAAAQVSQTGNIPYALNPQGFFRNRVTVLVPSSFVNAGSELIEAQYPDKDNLPKIVLTDRTQKPLLAMNMTTNSGDREDMVHFFRDIKNDIRTKYPTSRFLKTDVIRGRTLAVIEVILPNKDGEMLYNMMAFRYVGNSFFFLNFTCPEADMATWQNTAREIAENVKVNAVN